jgi:hypothetical protein
LSRGDPTEHGQLPIGRRERAKQDKRRASHGRPPGSCLRSTASVWPRSQQIADWADVAIGTLYLYASTKAELLIIVQNEKFDAAIDEGLVTASDAAGQDALDGAIALIRPGVECVREHVGTAARSCTS